VRDSLIKQSGSTVSVAGSESVRGNISSGGTIRAGGTISTPGTITTPGTIDAGALQGFFLTASQETFNGSVQFGDDGTSNFQTPLLINAKDCCNAGNRMIWAHSPGFLTWGIRYDDSADVMHWQQFNGSDLMTLDFANGNLHVTGAITAGVKDFKIDHPLDPTNKYLYHSSVESSEMMNIYTGNATLDNGGEGVVSLPKWFEALNTDFRYQLTAIGAAAPNLHVAEEIAHHQFRIAGGAPGMKVSWQVTGVRHDAYAKTHPLKLEVRKSEKERGHYVHPDAFGAPRLTQEEMLQQR
jgi:hypothetical protein